MCGRASVLPCAARAMNPIDHPHGGGEGRTKGGRHPVTPWGKPTKGAKTRKNKRTTKNIVRSRQRQEDARVRYDPLGLERPVRRRLSAQEGREAARGRAARK